jgi:hypothetical protein
MHDDQLLLVVADSLLHLTQEIVGIAQVTEVLPSPSDR